MARQHATERVEAETSRHADGDYAAVRLALGRVSGKLDGLRGFLLHENDVSPAELARYTRAVRDPAIAAMDFLPAPRSRGWLDWLKAGAGGVRFPESKPYPALASALAESSKAGKMAACFPCGGGGMRLVVPAAFEGTLLGHATLTVDLDKLMREAFLGDGYGHILARLGEEPADAHARPGDGDRSASVSRSFFFGGEAWRLTTVPPKPVGLPPETAEALAAGLAGMLLACLLAGLAAMAGARRQIEAKEAGRSSLREKLLEVRDRRAGMTLHELCVECLRIAAAATGAECAWLRFEDGRADAVHHAEYCGGGESKRECRGGHCLEASADGPDGTPLMSIGVVGHCGFDGEDEALLRLIGEEAVRLANERALEAAANSTKEMMAHMLRMLGHHLKTDLNHIVGFAETLKSDAYCPNRAVADCKENCGYVHKAGLDMASIIESIEMFSALVLGNLKASRSPFIVRDMLRSTLARHREDAEERGVAIEIDCPPDLAADGDMPKLRVALSCLVSNAVKFSRRGGVAAVRAAVAGDSLILSVEDDGIGMSAEVIARVLAEGGQGDRSHARAHDGVGLGAQIAMEIARLHGGSLSYAGGRRQGTLAALTIPGATKPLTEEPTA